MPVPRATYHERTYRLTPRLLVERMRARDLHRMKIFVVDDDPFALRLIQRQLESLSQRDVQTFDGAREPLALLSADPHAADVILLDLAMPDIDGMEFVQRLARLQFKGTLVFISGLDDRILQMAPVLASGLHLRVAGALKKPSSPEELRAVLDTVASTPAADGV